MPLLDKSSSCLRRLTCFTQVADPRFIRWASTRLEGVQTLRIAWETPKVTQQDVFKGLIELLAHMRTLQRLEVPHCLSLPAAVLSKLPATLVEASLSVAFDDSCLVDSHAPDGLEYALPASMPHLKGLDMQASQPPSVPHMGTPACTDCWLKGLQATSPTAGVRSQQLFLDKYCACYGC